MTLEENAASRRNIEKRPVSLSYYGGALYMRPGTKSARFLFPPEGNRSYHMRMLALGIIAAAGIALAGPAAAQGVYFGAGPGGVGVGVDNYNHGYYRDRDYDRGRIVVRERHRECRTIIVREDGMTRRIRRCR
jgi:hypothetical protein